MKVVMVGWFGGRAGRLADRGVDGLTKQRTDGGTRRWMGWLDGCVGG